MFSAEDIEIAVRSDFAHHPVYKDNMRYLIPLSNYTNVFGGTKKIVHLIKEMHDIYKHWEVVVAPAAYFNSLSGVSSREKRSDLFQEDGCIGGMYLGV